MSGELRFLGVQLTSFDELGYAFVDDPLFSFDAEGKLVVSEWMQKQDVLLRIACCLTKIAMEIEEEQKFRQEPLFPCRGRATHLIPEADGFATPGGDRISQIAHEIGDLMELLGQYVSEALLVKFEDKTDESKSVGQLYCWLSEFFKDACGYVPALLVLYHELLEPHPEFESWSDSYSGDTPGSRFMRMVAIKRFHSRFCYATLGKSRTS